MAVERPPLPVPPPPPAPPAVASCHRKKKLYQAIAEGKTPIEGDYEEPRQLLMKRESWKDLQWLLFNKYVPSLIQDGPQCGLVALWMAGHLLQPPTDFCMENIVKTAIDRGYTAQGEIFSAHDMALLAEETIGCRAERLTGGIGGANAVTILRHLADRQPVLIPYDEDFNHEPCQRDGHRAHWAVASGMLLGLEQGSLSTRDVQADLNLPWLCLPCDCSGWPANRVQEAFLLAKQGKSLRYQLWGLEELAQSNAQLREMDPQRAGDGSMYIVPRGGVEEGLGGQAVLLHVRNRN